MPRLFLNRSVQIWTKSERDFVKVILSQVLNVAKGKEHIALQMRLFEGPKGYKVKNGYKAFNAYT